MPAKRIAPNGAFIVKVIKRDTIIFQRMNEKGSRAREVAKIKRRNFYEASGRDSLDVATSTRA